MNRILIGVAAFALFANVSPRAIAQQTKSKGANQEPAPAEEQAQLVTEGEFAQWLVRVLGLSRFLPAAPTDLECFQILMQNGIMPRDGWQQDRPVTVGNLARVIVLALGKQAEVENPDDDDSWIAYLKSAGIDFGTIGEAIENLEPLPQPVGHEAIVTATDPLAKLARINPPDNQQIGADLSTLGRISGRVIRQGDLPPIEQEIRRPTVRPPEPPEMTPNRPRFRDLFDGV
jgi:hypothetical protein